MTSGVPSRQPGYSELSTPRGTRQMISWCPGTFLAAGAESSLFSWAPHEVGFFFFFWKGVSVKKSAYVHNTEPIIPAPGTRDVTGHWIPWGTPSFGAHVSTHIIHQHLGRTSKRLYQLDSTQLL